MKIGFATPRCLLVVAPHPDDETIGAHALIARLRRRGSDVRILVITDGSASHPGSPSWPRARLVSERQRETRRAMRQIGVAAGKITFLGLPDGSLAAVAALAARKVAAAVRAAPKPVLVLAPAPSDDHPDHRVVASGAAIASGAGITHLAYPVWPAGAKLHGAHRMTLSGGERLAKRHAIRGYRTQTGAITDDPAGFAMTRAQIHAFSGPIETFVKMSR